MEFNEYQRQAMVTKKNHASKKDQEIDGLLGIAGESGEVCEILKKHYSRGTPIDRDELIKELGDVMWYIAELCDVFGFTLEDVAQRNILKLAARHTGGVFSGAGNRTGEGK
ncbi:MAG: nucleoside triphosphate pyrophosphohydrolase family protein [Christensenellaceae bacterium]|jgi:NTP pyrophosphatase (non-canonical NTP hydrolase)|nr:nucleoside triphosphate pyrophosphohydrolase family protein [Christensenellaceae bacterium]